MALNEHLLPSKYTFDGLVLPGPPAFTPPADRLYGYLGDTLKYSFNQNMSINEIERSQERDKWADQDI